MKNHPLMEVTLVKGTPEIYNLYKYTFPVKIEFGDCMTNTQIESYKTLYQHIGYYKIELTPKCFKNPRSDMDLMDLNEMLGLNEIYFTYNNGMFNQLNLINNEIPVFNNDPLHIENRKPIINLLKICKLTFSNDKIVSNKGGKYLSIDDDKFVIEHRHECEYFDNIDDLFDVLKYTSLYNRRRSIIIGNSVLSYQSQHCNHNTIDITFLLENGSFRHSFDLYINICKNENGVIRLNRFIEETIERVKNIKFYSMDKLGNLLEAWCDSLKNNFVVIDYQGNKYKIDNLINIKCVIDDYLQCNEFVEKNKLKPIINTKSSSSMISN